MSIEDEAAHIEPLLLLVNVITDKSYNESGRSYSLQVFHEFLQNCPLLIPCGMKLVAKSLSAEVRHYGLKIIEHVVKTRWKEIPESLRFLLRNRILMLLSTESSSSSPVETNIREAIARLVVELARQEWPNKWPDMLFNLEEHVRKSDTQAELVMSILLKLLKDVVTNTNLPDSERSLIGTAMKHRMPKILDILVRVALTEHLSKYNIWKADPTHTVEAEACCRVVVAALHTLAGYFEYISVHHITLDKFKLLKLLWSLLGDSEMQVPAAECLIAAINRLDHVKGCGPLMCLFKQFIEKYLSPAKTADQDVTEKQYLFLKRQCQLLCALGEQLFRVETLQPIFETPAFFEVYLDTLFSFTTHPSQLVNSITLTMWRKFFSHKLISCCPPLLSRLPKYLQATITNLMKVGYPSKSDSPSCKYSAFDFDDDDFNEFLTAFFGEQRKVIEVICRLAFKECYTTALRSLKFQTFNWHDPEPTESLKPPDLNNSLPQSFLKWEASSLFFNFVISDTYKGLHKEDIPQDVVLKLLELVMDLKTKDPLKLACIQKHISMLIPYCIFKKDYLFMILFKFIEIIENIQISPAKGQVLMMARRCACCSILKLCQENALLILPDFEILYEKVAQLLWREQFVLTQMETNSLMEAMITVTNHYKDYEGQKAFIEFFLTPIGCFWKYNTMTSMVQRPEAFIRCENTKFKITTSLKGGKALKCSQIIKYVCAIFGALRWVQCPTDLKKAKAGGFIAGVMPNGKPIYRHPCTEPVLELLDNILFLIRLQHNLYVPQLVQKMDNEFVKILKQIKVDNASIQASPQPQMDSYDPSECKTKLERIRRFYSTLCETCFCILGHAASLIKHDFYAMEGLVGRLLETVLVNVDSVPDCRLLVMLRCFFKPLVHNCPPQYCETVLSPVVGVFLTYLHERLVEKWEIMDKRTGASTASTADEKTKSLKIGENHLKLLTSAVTEFIIDCCVSSENEDASVHADASVLGRKSGGKSGGKAAKSEGGKKAMKKPSTPELSNLGMCLIKEKVVRSTLLATAFSSLVWDDQFTNGKNPCHLCWLLLNQVILDPPCKDAVTYSFTMVFKGLQQHRDNEYRMNALSDLAFEIYDSLRPSYFNLKAVIMEHYPHITKATFKKFDELIISRTKQKMDVKSRKDMFKFLLLGGVLSKCVEGVDDHCSLNTPAPPPPPVKESNNDPPPTKKKKTFSTKVLPVTSARAQTQDKKKKT